MSSMIKSKIKLFSALSAVGLTGTAYLTGYFNRFIDPELRQRQVYIDAGFRPYSLTKRSQHSRSSYSLTLVPQNTTPVSSEIDLTKCVVSMQLLDTSSNSMRYFTPTQYDNDTGAVEFIVKEYPWPRGDIARMLNRTKVSGPEPIWIRGPVDDLELKSTTDVKKEENIGMIAGGTGITACWQLLHLLKHRGHPVNVKMLYASHSSDDVILRQELADFINDSGCVKLSLVHVCPQVTGEDKGIVKGRVTRAAVKQHIPSPEEVDKIYICGPDGLVLSLAGQLREEHSHGTTSSLSASSILGTLDYSPRQVFLFS